MELFLTKNCNLRCSYCFVGKKIESRMSEEVSSQAVKFIFDHTRHKVVDITFFGGEPLLEIDHIQAICEQARAMSKQTGIDILFHTTTNGTLLTKDVLHFLKENKIKFLLSIDGTQQSHDQHRKFADGTGSWQSIYDIIPLMKSYQPWQGARITPAPNNVGDLLEGVKILAERGINQFIIGPASGVKWSEDARGLWVDQAIRVGEYYIQQRLAKKHIRIAFFEKDLTCEPNAYLDSWGCGAGAGRVAVNPDGRLFGCSKIMTAHKDDEDTNKWCLGDVWKGYSQVAVRYRQIDRTSQFRTKCQTCEFTGECTGGCPAVNYQATGDIFTPDENECRLTACFMQIKGAYKRLMEKYNFHEG